MESTEEEPLLNLQESLSPPILMIYLRWLSWLGVHLPLVIVNSTLVIVGWNVWGLLGLHILCGVVFIQLGVLGMYAINSQFTLKNALTNTRCAQGSSVMALANQFGFNVCFIICLYQHFYS